MKFEPQWVPVGVRLPVAATKMTLMVKPVKLIKSCPCHWFWLSLHHFSCHLRLLKTCQINIFLKNCRRWMNESLKCFPSYLGFFVITLVNKMSTKNCLIINFIILVPDDIWLKCERHEFEIHRMSSGKCCNVLNIGKSLNLFYLCNVLLGILYRS
jgi:hypothetical protein